MDENRLKNLEDEVFKLRYEVSVIRNIISLKNVPGWAEHLKLKAESVGLRPSPHGEGYDIYRLLELLDKLGLLSEQGE